MLYTVHISSFIISLHNTGEVIHRIFQFNDRNKKYFSSEYLHLKSEDI